MGVMPGSPGGQPSVEINGAMDDDSTKSLRMEYGWKSPFPSIKQWLALGFQVVHNFFMDVTSFTSICVELS